MNLAIIKVTGCSSENFENAPKRYQNLVLWACPKFISTPKRYKFNNNNYITGTVNFNSNKDNFRTLSSQGPFKSIVKNLTETTLVAVILGFNTLSGTNP